MFKDSLEGLLEIGFAAVQSSLFEPDRSQELKNLSALSALEPVLGNELECLLAALLRQRQLPERKGQRGLANIRAN